MDQVHTRIAALSSKLKPEEVNDVLIIIIYGLEPFPDFRNVDDFFRNAKSSPPPQESEVQFIADVDTFQVHYEEMKSITMHVGIKQASRYGMMALFGKCVCNLLSKKCPECRFMIDHQFTITGEKTYFAYQALVSIVDVIGTATIRVLVVWEYKPKVAMDLSDQTPWRDIPASLLYVGKKSLSHTTLFD